MFYAGTVQFNTYRRYVVIWKLVSVWKKSEPEISRVLFSQKWVVPIYLGLPLPAASSVLPDRQAGHLIAILFGLATGGVYTASFVTKAAVGSYPAFSPLPVIPEKPSAVCFLLHFPSARAVWLLASTLTLCCPDFPPAYRYRERSWKLAATYPTLMITKLTAFWIRSSKLVLTLKIKIIWKIKEYFFRP